jgi:translation elongation factor EF-4
MPRPLFVTALQAASAGRGTGREARGAGSEKQGARRMKQTGTVEVPREAILAVLKVER